jgi:hypothetical protein
MATAEEATAQQTAEAQSAQSKQVDFPIDDKPVEAFGSSAGFALGQRIATALSRSTLVPEAYRGNLPNSLIAVEMAARIGCSPLMVMQNLHVIQGRPSWASTFIIASINSCGRYSPLRFVMSGDGDSRTCRAQAMERATGELLDGPEVSIAMAKAEGWHGRNGSKWKTMPELMLRYRAAAFFGRLYAPEMLLGMHSVEESSDAPTPEKDITPRKQNTGVSGAKAMLSEAEREGEAVEGETG